MITLNGNDDKHVVAVASGLIVPKWEDASDKQMWITFMDSLVARLKGTKGVKFVVARRTGFSVKQYWLMNTPWLLVHKDSYNPRAWPSGKPRAPNMSDCDRMEIPDVARRVVRDVILKGKSNDAA